MWGRSVIVKQVTGNKVLNEMQYKAYVCGIWVSHGFKYKIVAHLVLLLIFVYIQCISQQMH